MWGRVSEGGSVCEHVRVHVCVRVRASWDEGQMTWLEREELRNEK